MRRTGAMAVGINLKEVHENTTSDEWSERYDEMFCDSQLLILALVQENTSLKRQRMAVLAGLATATAIVSAGVLFKKRGND